MFSKWRNCRTPIGIDVGVRTIKAVQLESHRGNPRLSSVLTLPLQTSGALDENGIKELANALRRHGFGGNKVILACPPKELHTAILELPPATSGAPLDKIAEAELRRACRVNDDEIEVAWWGLPSVPNQAGATSVMAIGAPCRLTEALSQTFSSVGLDVIAVDTVATALARACGRLSGDGLSLVTDLGGDAATVALIHGGQLVYQRAVPELGADILRRAVSDEMELDEEETACVLEQVGVSESQSGDACSLSPRYARLRSLVWHHLSALATELETALSYATHEYAEFPVGNIFLTGGGANIAGLDTELTDRLSMPASILTLGKLVEVDVLHGSDASSLRHAVAVGLAMSEVR